MPQNTFAPAFTSRFNPQPVITTTPGELESAQLERRLRLAQIQNLELQPQQEQRLFQEKQREFDIGQQHESDVLGETSRFHQGTLANEQDRTQIAKEQLASQIEQHKTEQNTAIVDTLMRTAPLLGLDKEDVGDVLNRMGHSELAAHFAAKHEQEQAKKVAQVKTGLVTGVIKENEVDPTILQQIKQSSPGQVNTTPPVEQPQLSLAKKIGVGARLYPAALAAPITENLAVAKALGKAPVKQYGRDFWQGLTGQ